MDDWELEEGPLVWRMVADGAGDVWVRGPWELTRVNLESGESTRWDASDDAVFLSRPGLAASSGSGVWLLADDEALLFDGARFVRRLRVPAEVLPGVDAADAADRVDIYDVAEVGSDVWMSVSMDQDSNQSGVVVRWSQGRWEAMSGLSQGIGGELAAQGSAGVWSAGWDIQDLGNVVRHWGGSSWSLPGDGQGGTVPEGSGEVVVDARGAVWFLGGELLRLDGVDWEVISDSEVEDLAWELDGEVLSFADYRTGWLAVTPAGEAWVASSYGVARFSADGEVAEFGVDQGLEPPIRGLTTSGDRVLAFDGRGLAQLEGDQFTRVWKEPVSWAWESAGLMAVSHEEVWARRWTAGVWARFADGEWATTQWRSDTGGPVVAGDGALWLADRSSLTRIEDGRSRTVLSGIEGPVLGAGPEGSVWIRGSAARFDSGAGGGLLERVSPQGKRMRLTPPTGFEQYCTVGVGLDGSVWLALPVVDEEDPECHTYFDLARWDGQTWSVTSTRDLPGDLEGALSNPVVADDGALWGWVGEPQSSTLVRYDGQEWEEVWLSVDRGARGATLIPAPDDRMCAHVEVDLICYRADGSSITVTSDALRDGGVAVAPDGAIWVGGEQIARLAESLPGVG